MERGPPVRPGIVAGREGDTGRRLEGLAGRVRVPAEVDLHVVIAVGDERGAEAPFRTLPAPVPGPEPVGLAVGQGPEELLDSAADAVPRGTRAVLRHHEVL